HGLHSTGVTAFYSKRRSADHGNETRTDSSESSKGAKSPLHLAGPSHHARPGAGESIKDSEAIRRRGGWSDGGGGEGELRGLDRAGAPIHPSPGISRAEHSAGLYPQAWQDGEAPARRSNRLRPGAPTHHG